MVKYGVTPFKNVELLCLIVLIRHTPSNDSLLKLANNIKKHRKYPLLRLEMQETPSNIKQHRQMSCLTEIFINTTHHQMTRLNTYRRGKVAL